MASGLCFLQEFPGVLWSPQALKMGLCTSLWELMWCGALQKIGR